MNARIPRILIAIGKGWPEHDTGHGYAAIIQACPPGSEIRVVCSKQDLPFCQANAAEAGMRFVLVSTWDDPRNGLTSHDLLILVHPAPEYSIRGMAMVKLFNRMSKPVVVARTVEECQNWSYVARTARNR